MTTVSVLREHRGSYKEIKVDVDLHAVALEFYTDELENCLGALAAPLSARDRKALKQRCFDDAVDDVMLGDWPAKRVEKILREAAREHVEHAAARLGLVVDPQTGSIRRPYTLPLSGKGTT